MINIGDKVLFKIRRSNNKIVEFEGIVHGKTSKFGEPEYLISEYKGLKPISIRIVKKK